MRHIKLTAIALVAVMILSVVAVPAFASDHSSHVDEGEDDYIDEYEDSHLLWVGGHDTAEVISGDDNTAEEFNASDDELYFVIEQDLETLDSNDDEYSDWNVTVEDDDEYVELQWEDDADEMYVFDEAGEEVDDIEAAGGEAGAWAEYHFHMTEEDFEELPVEINENVDVDATVEYEDEADEEQTEEFTFTLSTTDERSVINVDSDSVDDDDVGPDATTEEVEVGGFWVSSFGADETDHYYVEDERDVNGSDTTLEIHLTDGDAADAFADLVEAEDGGLLGGDELEDGDPITEMAVLVDDDLVATYLNEAGDVDEDDHSYAVYHEDADRMDVHLGDNEHEDTEEAEIHVASHEPNFDGFADSEAIAAAYASDLGIWDLQSHFSINVAFQGFTMDDDDLLYGAAFIIVGAGAVPARKQAVEANVATTETPATSTTPETPGSDAQQVETVRAR